MSKYLRAHGKPWMKRVLIPSLFIIYPPNSKKILKVFLVLFHLSFWIKEKSVVTLSNRNICDQMQNTQVSFSTVSQSLKT